MSEFHDDYPQYEFMAQHSEEEGKKARKKLWGVFWIMLAVTILELIIGFQASSWGLLNPDRTSSVILKVIFIGLTIGKAYFIVFSFMHLGHERKWMKWSVLAPYMIFIIYLVFIIVGEANYSLVHKEKMDELIVDQKNALNEAAKNGPHGLKKVKEEHDDLKHSEGEHHTEGGEHH
jgi:cytochrome c oxidase subunit IV